MNTEWLIWRVPSESSHLSVWDSLILSFLLFLVIDIVEVLNVLHRHLIGHPNAVVRIEELVSVVMHPLGFHLQDNRTAVTATKNRAT